MQEIIQELSIAQIRKLANCSRSQAYKIRDGLKAQGQMVNKDNVLNFDPNAMPVTPNSPSHPRDDVDPSAIESKGTLAPTTTSQPTIAESAPPGMPSTFGLTEDEIRAIYAKAEVVVRLEETFTEHHRQTLQAQRTQQVQQGAAHISTLDPKSIMESVRHLIP